MSYIINKTDGSVLTEVVDGTIDQITTDITLVGKNATTYGELFNENFIKILENFANTTQPNKPLEGQLWYDTTEGRLKVYDGSGFKVSGGTIVATSIPSSIAAGDIWIDSFRQQMYFNDGNANLLAGPIYTAQQGISGFQTVDVIDTNNINHTVLFVYVAQTLIGIFSTATFTPLNTIPGFTGQIKVGFTGAYSAIKFNAAASQADSLVATNGTLKTAESFLQVDPVDGYTVANGTIRVLNNTALVLGANQNTEFKVSNNTFQVNSNIINQNLAIQTYNTINGLKSAMFVNATNERVGIFTSTPTATFEVAGDAVIQGSLTVNGNLTTVSTTNLEIEDKLIEIGKTALPTNTTADGGGILLEAGADVDKTFTWSNSKSAWDSSENMNVASGKVYKVNNFPVISQTELGPTVYKAYLTQIANTLQDLSVDNLLINDNTISFVNSGIADGNIILTPKGAGHVSVSSKRVANLSNPIDPADAVNLSTLEQTKRSIPLGLSVNIGVLTEAQLSVQVLAKIYPPSNYEENTYLRVWCIDTSTAKEFRLISSVWTFQSDI